MESKNGSSSREGVLIPASTSSDAFALLESAHLYEASKQCFQYNSAITVKNPALEKKYNAFRAQKREIGYSEEELKESYGFLLFDDVDKANAFGENGAVIGNSTCTALGDPAKGVYISLYSDCLDINHWYDGKSGYIGIIKLTKGRVKKVLEKYTQNFTAPTKGYDCHVSEEFSTVSSNTSSFLAFGRTQCYMYELLDDDRSGQTIRSPSAACPFAIVSFSYTDTKATLATPQYKSEGNELVHYYFTWKGQLQICTHFYDFGLRSREGALIPAELPPVVKVERAISMSDLRRVLPKTIFETHFSGEVFLGGLHCSLCELISFEAEQTNSISLLLWEIKNKDIALTIPLNDGGFLLLLHSSNFLKHNDSGCSASDFLQGMFVFPDSRIIRTDTEFGHGKSAVSSEILRVLPLLSYADGEVEKTTIDPSEELCEVFMQHMQNYTALINPGLAESSYREISVFPDEDGVSDAHKKMYSSPEWTKSSWQNLSSYMSKPDSFQLPLSKTSEMTGLEKQIEALDDSSAEEIQASHVVAGLKAHLTGQKSLDICLNSGEGQAGLTAAPQSALLDNLLIKTDDMETKTSPTTSDDLPTELIVSITSAERTVTDACLNSTESKAEHDDNQLSYFPATRFQTTAAKTLNDETCTTKKVLGSPQLTKPRKLNRGQSKDQKHVSKTDNDMISVLDKDHHLRSQKEQQASETGHSQLNNPSNLDSRTVQKYKSKMNQIKNEKLTPATVVTVSEKSGLEPVNFENTFLMQLQACTQRKKTERWDLKPVISKCGRILVPHGSLNISDQIKVLQNMFQPRKDKMGQEEMWDISVNVQDVVEIDQDSRVAPEPMEETKASPSKAGGNCPQKLVSEVRPEHVVSIQSDDENNSSTLNPKRSEHSSQSKGTDSPLVITVQEKPADTPVPSKCATKGELVLNKLKSILLRGKRKEQETTDNTERPEACLKKGKADSHVGMLKSMDVISSVQDPDGGIKEVPTLLSVDPQFAFALGLTPKEIPDMTEESEDVGTQERKDSSETHKQTISDRQPQIVQSHLSVFPHGRKIKTLKKDYRMSAEYVKKEWWLHFQTPAGTASKNLKSKECIGDNSFQMTAKEESACTPTDALNLLADLALSVNSDQVVAQPEQATRPKKCNLAQDVVSTEEESGLHTLLTQSAARPIEPHESPSPSHVLEGSELAGLITEEHAYSLRPSASLLMTSPGTPFQVSPLRGSTRLLHHHQTMVNCDGFKYLPIADQENKNEHNHKALAHGEKLMVRRRKLRKFRTFIVKDGSLQVTRYWKRNYDFDRDSKFTNDSTLRSICRALHGPWAFSIQDTREELRLIFHMWIGLFYSRSTPRFFHFDTNLCSEESQSLEIPSETDTLFAACCNTTEALDTFTSTALDFSNKERISFLDQGAVILDLSQRNSTTFIVTSDPQVNQKDSSLSGEQKEASKTLNTPVGLQDTTFQYCRNGVNSTEIINEAHDVRSTPESERICTPLQRPDCLDHNYEQSLKGGEILHSVDEDTETLSVQSDKTDLGDGSSDGCEKTEIMCLFDKDSNKELHDMAHKTETKHVGNCKETEESAQESDIKFCLKSNLSSDSKNMENCEEEVKLVQEDRMEISPTPVHTGSDSFSDVHNGDFLESENQLFAEEPNGDSPGEAENAAEDMDCCPVQEETVIKKHLFSKDDGPNVKECSISDLETVSYSSDQPLLMMFDGEDTLEKDKITDLNWQAPMEEQPPQEEHEENLCVNGSARTVHFPSEEEPIDNESTVAESLENICLADLNDQQFPKHDGPDSINQLPQVVHKEGAHCDSQCLNTASKFCVNDSALTDVNIKSNNATHSPVKNDPVSVEVVIEKNSENHFWFVVKPHHLKEALIVSDESTGIVEGSSASASIPQTNNSVEAGGQNKTVLTGLCDDGDWGTKSGEGEQNVENTILKERLYDQSHSPEQIRRLEKLNQVHFTGIDTSREDAIHPYDSQSKGIIEDVKDQKDTSFMDESAGPESVRPKEIRDASCMFSEKPQHSTSLPDPNEGKVIQPPVTESESDNRCPTPTVDEEPYQHKTSYGPSSSSTATASFRVDEPCKNLTKKRRSKRTTLLKDEMPLEQKHKSATSDQNLHQFHSDIEVRTERLKRSLDEFLCTSTHTDTYSQIQMSHVNHCVDVTHKQQPTSAGEEHFYSGQSFASDDCLQAFTPSVGKDGHQTSPQTSRNYDLRLCSRRPIMAVKPSKSYEDKAKSTSKDRQSKNTKTSPPKHPLETTPTSTLLKKKTNKRKGTPAQENDKQGARQLSHKRIRLSSFNKSNSGKTNCAPLDPLYSYEGMDISEFNKIPSSHRAQPVEFSKTSSKPNRKRGFLRNNLVGKVEQTAQGSMPMDQKYCSGESMSAAGYSDKSSIHDSLRLGPQSSLTCTIFNDTDQKRSYSFLEQLSKRCLQDDLTKASVEQECLIFSEQMKQLLKRSKRGPIHQQDAREKLNMSRSSPVTVNFSGLEELDDTEDQTDAPSFLGTRIKIDMTDRRDRAYTPEEDNAVHSKSISERNSNPVEHAGVSGVTAECAKRYTAMMNDVYADKKVSSRPTDHRMNRVHQKTEPRDLPELCDRMKREADYTFHSIMNSVVKSSCKRKYRFYLVVTSDDPFFEETKAQMEAEGHTAVHPSEVLLSEDSSSLLIILRNEDIAEHICEVPHLLKLKKLPDVRFAGIDEPDDVLNLTHQELFVRGGFIMFDRAALEALRLCDMEMVSELIQELRRRGKWKWMLHYRDKRWLKENARLSAEDKEKHRFVNWCQEAGILEVLPYHECDRLSRDQPDYLTCLVHLQVQNISTRYPVFITDTVDSSFGINGILTLTLSAILTCCPGEKFPE